MSLHKSAIIEKAQKLAAKGHYGQAIGEWEKLIGTLPDDGNTYNSIGDLHLKAGQQKQATNFFIKAAEVFRSAGFELKSIAIFKKVLKLDPSRLEISEKLAGVYADRGLLGNAMNDYLQAAKAYFSQGNFEASLSVYRKISDLDPSNTDTLLTIAEMSQKEGRHEEAIEVYKKLAALFEEKDQSSKAEAILQKILALEPSCAVKTEAPPEVLFEKIEPEAPLEDKAAFTDNEAHSDLPEPETPDSALLAENPSELFEPEPELMTDEQTIYSAEGSFQIGGTQEENADQKDTALFGDVDPDTQFDDQFPEEALFQEIYHEAAQEVEKEETRLFEAPALSNAFSDDLPLEHEADGRPVLEQDPPGSTADTVDARRPAKVDELFLDADPFSSKELEEASLSDDVYEIDFDEPSLGISTSPRIEVGDMGPETHKILEEEPEGPVNVSRPASAEDESDAKIKENYINLQTYFSEELEEDNETNPDRTIRTVQDKNPEEIESEYDLGIAYREMGMLSKAVMAFENASQGKSRFKDAITMLATCHRELGSIQNAFSSLEKGLSRSTSDQSAAITFKYELALLYDEERNLEKASHFYDAVFEIDPAYREVAKKREQVNRQISASPPPRSPTESFRVTKQKLERKKDRVSYL